jgi:hypothetical protein
VTKAYVTQHAAELTARDIESIGEARDTDKMFRTLHVAMTTWVANRNDLTVDQVLDTRSAITKYPTLVKAIHVYLAAHLNTLAAEDARRLVSHLPRPEQGPTVGRFIAANRSRLTDENLSLLRAPTPSSGRSARTSYAPGMGVANTLRTGDPIHMWSGGRW